MALAHLYTRQSSCRFCRMDMGLCFCKFLPQLDLATKVVIFMHQREHILITNTGMLTHRVLKNSQVVFRGNRNRNTVAREDFLHEPDHTFILFPSNNAQELNDDFLKIIKKPITLICPDGHWAQAKKIIRHEPSLQGLSCVKLPPGPPSNYRLRKNQIPGNVCTFEAVTRALGVLEGPKVEDQMNGAFARMTTRILWTRGRIREEEVVW